MNEFTLLNEKQFDLHKFRIILENIKKEKKHINTDFAHLLGATSLGRWYIIGDGRQSYYKTVKYINSYPDNRPNRYPYHEGYIGSYGSPTTRFGIAIRPVLPYDTLKLDTIKNEDGLLETEYGEYPQHAVNQELSQELETVFSKGEMIKTGKIYTTDSRPDDLSQKKFKPLAHEEYIYQGKKYVRIKTTNHITLSNTQEYYPYEYIWIEVSPITWYVDEENKLLISKYNLVGGIRYMKNHKFDDNFKNTEVYMFLNTYFAKDIIPSKIEKEEIQEEKETENKSKSESLMEEIYEYCKDLPNGEELTKRIDDLANEYNEKLAKIYELKKNKVPTLETFSAITNDLELKLNMILDDLKKHHEKYKTYFEMIDIINEYIDVVNGSEKESNNELTSDLNTIISVCIPFLKAEDSNKLKQELLTILNNQKKEIADYLHTSSIFNSITPSKELKYQTIDEMNLDLRKKLHPLLKDLSTSVNKRDIELEIKESMTKIINGLYSEPKNKLLSYYLSEINDAYTSIVNSLANIPLELQNEYKEKIASIMATKIDYNEDFITISKNLMKIWLSLNKVESEIEELETLKTAYIDTSKFKK